MNSDHVYDLKRFLSAQEGVYERALTELKEGQKRTHWMWFIFPKVVGLGNPSHGCRVNNKSEYIVFSDKAGCTKELEAMKANAP